MMTFWRRRALIAASTAADQSCQHLDAQMRLGQAPILAGGLNRGGGVDVARSEGLHRDARRRRDMLRRSGRSHREGLEFFAGDLVTLFHPVPTLLSHDPFMLFAHVADLGCTRAARLRDGRRAFAIAVYFLQYRGAAHGVGWRLAARLHEIRRIGDLGGESALRGAAIVPRRLIFEIIATEARTDIFRAYTSRKRPTLRGDFSDRLMADWRRARPSFEAPDRCAMSRRCSCGGRLLSWRRGSSTLPISGMASATARSLLLPTGRCGNHFMPPVAARALPAPDQTTRDLRALRRIQFAAVGADEQFDASGGTLEA